MRPYWGWLSWGCLGGERKHAVSSACFPVTRLSLNRLPFAAGPLSARAHQPSSVQPGHARPKRGHAGPVARGHRRPESTCAFPVTGGTGAAALGAGSAPGGSGPAGRSLRCTGWSCSVPGPPLQPAPGVCPLAVAPRGGAGKVWGTMTH